MDVDVAAQSVSVGEVEDTLYANVLSGTMTLHRPSKTKVNGRLGGFERCLRA